MMDKSGWEICIEGPGAESPFACAKSEDVLIQKRATIMVDVIRIALFRLKTNGDSHAAADALPAFNCRFKLPLTDSF